MWKFCGKTQFRWSFGWISRNSAETVPSHNISTPRNSVKFRYFVQFINTVDPCTECYTHKVNLLLLCLALNMYLHSVYLGPFFAKLLHHRCLIESLIRLYAWILVKHFSTQLLLIKLDNSLAIDLSFVNNFWNYFSLKSTK